MSRYRLSKSILGPDGRPAATPVASHLYPSPRWNLRTYKPRPWLASDTKSLVSEYDRAELVNYSRQLFAQIDVLSTGVRQKNDWAFADAWDPHYCGGNEAWGQQATEWLRDVWFPNANVRGAQYSFKRSQRISGMCWDVDGDDAMLLVDDSGFPRLAFYTSTKVGSYGADLHGGLSETGTVKGGRFDGAKIFDGVIYDRHMRAVGLRIIEENDAGYSDVPAYSADLGYEPTYHDQGRGIPRVATGLLRWMTLQDIDDFLQRGVKRAASIGLIQKNEEGEANVGNEIVSEEDPPSGTDTDRRIAYEEIEGGEMYYLSTLGNESIEALTYKNPHPNTEAFIERITRGALASVGWFQELIDLRATGRAPSRILCDLANQSIWSRQTTGLRRWKRAIRFAIAKAMQSGFLPRNEEGMDPYLWEPGLPKPLSVDAGNDLQADREGLKLGITNKSVIAQKYLGAHYKEVDRQRAKEIRETIEMAQAIARDYPAVSFDRALELLEQRSPNPQTVQQPARATQPGATTPPTKPTK